MEFDGARAQAQRFRDLRAAFPLANEVEDLPLARRQSVERRIIECRGVAKAPPRNLRRYIPLTVEDVADGVVELVGGCALRNEPVRTGLEGEIRERAIQVLGRLGMDADDGGAGAPRKSSAMPRR